LAASDHPRTPSLTAVRAVPAVCVLAIAGALAFAHQASAAGCPTATYLDYNHLAYAEVSVPAMVALPPGSAVGAGTIDKPTSANGCKRGLQSVKVLSVGPIDPGVAVLASGMRRTIFVIGSRCAGFRGSSYWDCLLRPLVFDGHQFTATSYPSAPAPRRTVSLGAAIGTAQYRGKRVTVRRIDGVDPSLAVGVTGEPSDAFLSPSTCPYGGFSNDPRYDNLLRCLHSPVWFTFDPPGSEGGGTVVARSDRPVTAAVAGASISLARLAIAADLVPPNPRLVPVGRVAGHVSLKVPGVPPGIYEAVVSCPRCSASANGAGPLYPAGSILVSPTPKTSLVIRIISYALAVAVLAALALGYRARRRRRAQGLGRPSSEMGRTLGAMLLGPGPAGSSRRARSWSEDAAARPPARGAPAPEASPRAKPAAQAPQGGRRRASAPRRRRKRRGG
jgi:hypothetical protein